MCGIAGLAAPDAGRAGLLRIGEEFAHRLRHRGPDGNGVEFVAEFDLVMAHARLAIQDTSESAAQPMTSADGRFTISYNGEVYNHAELRAELIAGGVAPSTFRGHGDTETLVAAIAVWGLAATLERCRGMFALAVVDRHLQTLSLARDRFGQKPLYHGQVDHRLMFASDLAALGPLRRELTIDGDALDGYLRAGAVPGRQAIFEGFSKVMPGEIVTYTHRWDCFELTGVERYWDYEAEITAAAGQPFAGSFDDALDELERVLLEAVELRLLSDVPVGSLLSGGVDSTLVTALMQRASSTTVNTFTAGFPGYSLDESDVAAAVATKLGTHHKHVEVGHDDMLSAIPAIVAMNGEPFADPSQIPTYVVSRLARESVTVCLAGDGGDELFGGYPTQRRSADLVRLIGRVPVPIRMGIGSMLGAAAPALDLADPGRARRARTAAASFAVEDPLDARLALSGCWKEGEVPLSAEFLARHPSSDSRTGNGSGPVDWPDFESVEHQMLWYDGVTFLPDQVLTKVDRASMWVSLEARAPMLDHEVARLAWRLPMSWRLGPDRAPMSGKWILRRLLDRYIPRHIMDRPKQGFAPPVADWLRHELSDWAGDLLSPTQLKADGYLDHAIIAKAWDAHTRRGVDNARKLWAVLMFQAWLEEIKSGR